MAAKSPKPAKPKPAKPTPANDRWDAVLVFGVALALRLLYWQATPDRGWAHPAAYEGDATVWLTWARARALGVPFELGLPLRPPGMAWFVGLFTDADASVSIASLRFTLCVLGAATAVLLARAARPVVGRGGALAVGLAVAGANGLIRLSVSVNNETPYLFLVAIALLLAPGLRDRKPSPWAVAGFAAVNAVACLVRAEHLLFWLAAEAWLAWGRGRHGGVAAALRPAALAGCVFLVCLTPWHLVAWRASQRANEVPPTSAPDDRLQEAVERAVAHLEWTPDALARRSALPAFCRRASANFVAATVAVRGGERVTARDFEILDRAFGASPQPLSEHFFVALYGGLNFHLANHPGADGGFSRGPLAEAPPLAGGPWPVPLVQGLPPDGLALTYPPHLAQLVDGYRLGTAWIRSNPAAFVRLVGAKLRRFAAGLATGLGGWNLPLGPSGIRWPVDMAVATGVLAGLWTSAVLGLAAIGLLEVRRLPEAVPWLLLLASKILVAVVFYGYARQGATALPAVALLTVLAVAPRLPELDSRRRLRLGVAAACLLLLPEIVRFAAPPEVRLDGRPIVEEASRGLPDPWPRRYEESWMGDPGVGIGGVANER